MQSLPSFLKNPDCELLKQGSAAFRVTEDSILTLYQQRGIILALQALYDIGINKIKEYLSRAGIVVAATAKTHKALKTTIDSFVKKYEIESVPSKESAKQKNNGSQQQENSASYLYFRITECNDTLQRIEDKITEIKQRQESMYEIWNNIQPHNSFRLRN